MLKYLLLLYAFANPSTTDGNFTLVIDNVRHDQGTIYLAVFTTAEDFDNERNAVYQQAIDVTQTGSIRIDIPVTDHDYYCIGLYHDVDGNGELDKNGMGIPQEPYALSNNPDNKWSAPDFSDIRFRPQAGAEQRLTLMYWKER